MEFPPSCYVPVPPLPTFSGFMQPAVAVPLSPLLGSRKEDVKKMFPFIVSWILISACILAPDSSLSAVSLTISSISVFCRTRLSANSGCATGRCQSTLEKLIHMDQARLLENPNFLPDRCRVLPVGLRASSCDNFAP